jgi:hypothetical protein
MLDTYFDKQDWPVWMNRKSSLPSFDDPLYYNHSLYCNAISRDVAQAKDAVKRHIDTICAWHKVEIESGLTVGHPDSVFDSAGKFVNFWSHK